MIKPNTFRRELNLWSVLSTIFIFIIIVPNISIIEGLFNPVNDTWLHIRKYLLLNYIWNSVILIITTVFFTVLIGVTCAWLISAYDFPFRRFFKWALILPLAVPPYMGAYTYNGIFNYTGIIQTFLRNNLNLRVSPNYFDIMSIQGAIFIFTMFLFPYVYIITLAFLERQASSLIESSKLLGRNSLETFLYVVLPISRTAIVGGTSLVILEILNDYGVVQYFGIPTFSTAIFKTWFSMSDIDSAIKLASVLMIIIFLVLWFEKTIRGHRQYSFSNTKIKPIRKENLKEIKAIIASVYCFTIISFSFFIPVAQLIQWSILTYKKVLNIEFFEIIQNSVSIAFVTSLFIVIIAIIIANYSRTSKSIISKIYSRITIIGYSIPGAVIAIGVIVFFVALDNRLSGVYNMFSISKKLFLSTSIIMLVFAYVIRFLAIGYNAIEAGFDKVGIKFFEASKMLGMSTTKTFFKIDFKMILPSIISGFILVFVDILKELPLTLILRPFNFNTLATKSFQYANDEMIHEAAISSLIIIIISVISIIVFNYNSETKSSSPME